MTLHRAGLGLAALLIALTIACSGDSDDPVTAEEAAAIVAAGTLTVDDLPDGEWVVEDVADGDDASDESGVPDANDLFNGVEACAAVEAAMDDIGQADVPSLAELERTFTIEDEAALVSRSISSNVAVPDPASNVDIDEAFEALRDAFAIDNIRPCFEEGFAKALGGEESGLTVSSIEVTEPEFVAKDGVGIQVRIEAIALIIPINLNLQMHFWPSEPAVGMLMMMELNSDTLSDEAASIVGAAQDRLATAVEEN